MIGIKEEWNRLEPALDAIFRALKEKGSQCDVAIDSFESEIILRALENFPVTWVNDIKGALEEEDYRRIAKTGCTIVVMHSLGVPPTKTQRIRYEENPMDVIAMWGEKMIQKLSFAGFDKEKIIIDPGIGFGQDGYQGMDIIRNIGKLKKRLESNILVGHSRKSFTNLFNAAPSAERDIETLAISERLYEQGANYLRVHNVAMHQRFFVARQVALNAY